MYEGGSVGLGELEREVHRLLHGRAGECHPRAESLGGGDLGDGGVAWHEHLAGDPAHTRGLGDCAGVVSRARRHEAGGRPLTEGGQLAQSAAKLEGTGALERLGLQHRPAAGQLVELLTGHRRCQPRAGRERAARAI